MKNQYFGDVNDLVKYAIVRILVDGDLRRSAVCWMLTADDDRSDGRQIDYLNQPRTYRPLDPSVFEALRVAVTSGSRNVSVVREQQLIPGAIYFEDVLTDSRPERSAYFEKFWEVAAGCGLAFFDPDNGLEVPSTRLGRHDSSKYLFMDELKQTYERGHSVLVYQHFPRVQRDNYIQAVRLRVKKHLGATPLFLRTARVLFILVAREEDRASMFDRLEFARSRWTRHISVESPGDLPM